MYSNKLFQKFCKERNIKEGTMKGYDSALKKYISFHHKSIDYLINEALKDEEKRIPLKERKIKKRLLEYRSFLLSSNMSPNTAKTYFSKLKTFYLHFEIELPHLPDAKYNKIYETNYLDLPTKEHIKQALELIAEYYLSLIELYRALLNRLDNSVNFLMIRCISFAHKLVREQMSIKLLPKSQQAEIMAMVSISKVLKSMVDKNITMEGKTEKISSNVAAVKEEMRKQKEEIKKLNEAA